MHLQGLLLLGAVAVGVLWVLRSATAAASSRTLLSLSLCRTLQDVQQATQRAATAGGELAAAEDQWANATQRKVTWAASGAAIGAAGGLLGAGLGAFLGGLAATIKDIRDHISLAEYDWSKWGMPYVDAHAWDGSVASIPIPDEGDGSSAYVIQHPETIFNGRGSFEACRRSGMFSWRPGDVATPISADLYAKVPYLTAYERDRLTWAGSDANPPLPFAHPLHNARRICWSIASSGQLHTQALVKQWAPDVGSEWVASAQGDLVQYVRELMDMAIAIGTRVGKPAARGYPGAWSYVDEPADAVATAAVAAAWPDLKPRVIAAAEAPQELITTFQTWLQPAPIVCDLRWFVRCPGGYASIEQARAALEGDSLVIGAPAVEAAAQVVWRLLEARGLALLGKALYWSASEGLWRP